MQAQIYIQVKKTALGFMGQIVAYEAGHKLWTDQSEIERITFDDALVDAQLLKEDIEAINIFS